jgi:hypothetical protein
MREGRAPAIALLEPSSPQHRERRGVLAIAPLSMIPRSIRPVNGTHGHDRELGPNDQPGDQMMSATLANAKIAMVNSGLYVESQFPIFPKQTRRKHHDLVAPPDE